MKPEPGRGPIAFAERVLTLLDEGSFTATYKYAVLLAMMDVCLEQATRNGTAPTSITTRQLAEKVVELYWPHAAPFTADGGTTELVLLQNRPSRGRTGQAAIVSAIARFRQKHAPDPSAPLMRAQRLPKFETIIRTVEWKLVEMPLPRLQQIGQTEVPFIYRINWDRSIRRRDFDDHESFDNTLRFVGDAGDHLVRLAGLLRPLIQRQWAAMVARFNTLPDTQLDEFLFGASRTSLTLVRNPLRELQDNRCFYCDARLPASPPARRPPPRRGRGRPLRPLGALPQQRPGQPGGHRSPLQQRQARPPRRSRPRRALGRPPRRKGKRSRTDRQRHRVEPRQRQIAQRGARDLPAVARRGSTMARQARVRGRSMRSATPCARTATASPARPTRPG